MRPLPHSRKLQVGSKHAVRGFLAGVVRKKLGLELVSAVETDQRIYRIIAAKRA